MSKLFALLMVAGIFTMVGCGGNTAVEMPKNPAPPPAQGLDETKTSAEVKIE